MRQDDPEERTRELKVNLEEFHDFVAVSERVWKFLRAWYGFDVEICKRLVLDQNDPQNLTLEIK